MDWTAPAVSKMRASQDRPRKSRAQVRRVREAEGSAVVAPVEVALAGEAEEEAVADRRSAVALSADRKGLKR